MRPETALISMATAYRTSQLVFVAAKLGIADVIGDQAMSGDEIATALGASSDAVGRMMRGLAMLGVFRQVDDGRFANTDLSWPLRSDSGSSVRAAIVYWGQEQYTTWGELAGTVMSGEPAFRKLFGDPFDYYDHHPDTAAAYDSFMTGASVNIAESVATNYEFPDTGTVVDIAGGEGLLLAAILEKHPRLRGILFERPPTLEKARSLLESRGLLSRCELVSGDFRKSLPEGADVYVMKNVLHDWHDIAAVAILSGCCRSMNVDSRLLVVQRLFPAAIRDEPYVRHMIEADVMQMLYNGGRERTLDEYRALVARAGLELTWSLTTLGETTLMEARRR
jgi:hypothetical protein